jgi:integrase
MAKAGPPEAADAVFRSGIRDGYRTAWEHTLERAKLTGVRWHDLRHTFASWAVQRRVSLYELRDLLGHSSLTMVKRYAHLAREHPRAAAAALDDVLASKWGTFGEPSRDRTEDPLIKSQVLYQLS